ncbi:ankyrin [Annulohypoxylon maeteangense]|uniref:ankyrin n=1 Tax=Annulohypoxylon maeteangense TaxID=1927788 RepID=UPI00200743EE|nr:ankyrin [Annulohypoxylon maeteangense]KAI0883859.1 ankyrin [Annulohypoxylon maeteangense]
MDVISAIGSFISIGQALAAIPKIIDIFRSVVEARQELLQLVNDVELLNSLGIFIRETMDNLDNDSKAKFRIPQLSFLLAERVRADLASIVPRLEELAHKCQQGGKGKGKGNSQTKITRLKWLHHKSQIASLSERARKNCNDLQTILSLSSFFATTAHGRMIIDIHTVVMNQAHPHGSQLSSLQPPSQSRYIGAALSYAVDTELEGSNEHSLQMVKGTLPQLSPTERAPQEPPIQLVATLSRSCKYCQCQCHSPTSRTQPNPLVSPIYGWLKSAYNIIPRVDTRRCDVSTCRRACSPVRVNIRLPLPFYSRMLEATLSLNSVVGVGASLHLRVARIIPLNSSITYEIRLNKIDMVRQRFSRGEISPIDVFEGTICIIEMAAYEHKLDILALLLQDTTSILRDTDALKRLAVFARAQLHRCRVSEREKTMLQGVVALDEDTNDYPSPIHEAIQQDGNLAAILRDSSEGIDSRDNFGISPLHLAVFNNNVNAIGHLLSHGANPDTLDVSCSTPLILAAKYGRHDCIQALVNGGYDINMSRPHSYHAFHCLVASEKEGSAESAKYLLENGANLARKSNLGNLALHTLAQYPQAAEIAEKFQLLVHAGLNVEEQNRYGRTPLGEALSHNNITMAHLLMNAGCKFNDTSEDRNDLPWIALFAHAETMGFIGEAEFTIDVRWRDVGGYTPLDMFEWRMNTSPLPGLFETPSDDDIKAFGELLSGVRDRYLNAEILTLETIITHLKEHNCTLARETLKYVIEEKIKWNIPAEYRTFRAIDVQIKEEMIEAAIESLEEFMEVSRSHIGTDPFEDYYCNSYGLEDQELVAGNAD